MNIDETALKTIVAKAIFDGITPEQRQALLTKAINSLLTVPPATVFGSAPKTTPLQDIFENEVRILARDLIKERFKTDPNLPQLVGAIVTKAVAAMSADDNVAREIAHAISRALERANSRD